MSDIREATGNAASITVSLVTTAETVIMSSSPIPTPFDNSRVLIIAYANLQEGTGTTSVRARIRRGTAITDPQVQASDLVTTTVVGGAAHLYQLMALDSPGVVDDVVYSLTLQQTAATGNGSATVAGILVLVL